ncbi:MAG: M14 family metallopeptidase [Planctomycetota bacterium]
MNGTKIGLGLVLILTSSLAALAQEPPDRGFALFPGGEYRDGIPRPSEFYGQELGSRFTPHHEVLRYVDAVAEAAPDRVRSEEYGRTAEGRPLRLLTVTAPENLERLAEIRAALDKIADPRKLGESEDAEALIESIPAIVWLSFNVHGNEPSPTEAALATLYQLAAGIDARTQSMLEETIVLIDPVLNPDGRERYVSWFSSVAAPGGNPDPNATEHDEPWPGGRTNHFYFDLNRDWAWLTQDETRARLPHFLAWHPQVHVDFHEMGHNSTYFFFPAEAPINQNFPPMITEWGQRFGQGNATAFDAFGWPYYTAESFDLYYPGYGDSYPSLHGAIGMTYEQAGHSAGGVVIEREDGSLLTLRDRLHHHFIAAMATVETAATGRRELLTDYADFRRQSIYEGRWGRLKEFVLEASADPHNTAELIGLLLDHGVEIERATEAFEVGGVHSHDDKSGPPETRSFQKGTYLVSMAQPSRTLAMALLEPHSAISKLTFYDISAWSLPFAFGVKAHWSEERADVPREPVRAKPEPVGGVEGPEAKVGYLLPWTSTRSALALNALLALGYRAGCAQEAFELRGRRYPRGTIVIPTAGAEDLKNATWDVAMQIGVTFEGAPTAFTEKGIDLGSSQIQRLERPVIAVASGPGVSANSYGAVRFLMERQYGFDFTTIPLDRLTRVDLTRYNVLVLPDGYGYEGDIEALKRWIRDGGVLIAIGGAASWASKEGSGLTAVSTRVPRDDGEAEDDDGWVRLDEQRERRRRESTPGAIVAVDLEPAHPLAFGYDSERLHALVSSRRSFGLDVGIPVAVFPEDASVAGFLPEPREAAIAGRAYLVDVPMGRGHVVLFAEDPNFRLFWNGLTRLFLNSLLLLDKQPVYRSR